MTTDIPMLGDPMEMAGKPYRQFLVERWNPHPQPAMRAYPGIKTKYVLWVWPEPLRPCRFYDGSVIDCTFYRVAEESLRFYATIPPAASIWICRCQGRFLE